MKIGYARATSLGEDTIAAVQTLRTAGCERIYTDPSGKEREGLTEMLNTLNPGDEVFADSLERLSRSVNDLLNIIRRIMNSGATLTVMREGVSLNDPPVNYLLNILIDFQEQSKASARHEGIKKAVAAGKYKGSTGRPKERTDWDEFGVLYRRWKAKEIKQADMCMKLNISRRTLDRRIKEYESTLSQATGAEKKIYKYKFF